MTVPDGVWTPIMPPSMRFHGDIGGNKDAYGTDLGMESLSGSPSSYDPEEIAMHASSRVGW